VIRQIHERERAGFLARHPRCAELAQRGAGNFLYGVPMHWMNDWGTPHPVFVREARGARLTCADGHEHSDFCLADTGAMFGHSPPALREALQRQVGAGLGAMLAGEGAPEVGALLEQRFGLPFWQFALSATDANRFCIRWARAASGRSDILVFDGCYHGTVDDTLVDLTPQGARSRASLLGQVGNLAAHTRVVEFNDTEALARALADRGVACVVAEPALTNAGMVLPAPGFLAFLREQCSRTGTILLLDETHTLSAGPAGMAREAGIEPDVLVVGKAIAGGVPCAVYGFTAALARAMREAKDAAPPGHSGIGTTLAGNLLSIAALRATLSEVATPQAYEAMVATCARLAFGLEAMIARHDLPWSVSRIGARCELQFCRVPPRTAREAHAAMDDALERALHLYLLNRGVLLTPFHNMMLASPATTDADVDRLLAALEEFLAGIHPCCSAH
jgi:glutamate-1-semialdehyde 2,1-aminomutase